MHLRSAFSVLKNKDKLNSFIFTQHDKPQRHHVAQACSAGAETVLVHLTLLIKENKLLDKQKEMLNHTLIPSSEHQTKVCTKMWTHVCRLLLSVF